MSHRGEQEGNRESKALSSAGLKVSNAPLQTQNGEHDSVSLASGVIQRYWARVLVLATDTPAAGKLRHVTCSPRARD